MNNGSLLHVVLVSFYPNMPTDIKQGIFESLWTLGTDCGGENAGVLFWQVGWNLDLRKNVHLVEVALFRDAEALEAFRQHPKHVEVGARLRAVADWQVGDLRVLSLLTPYLLEDQA